MKAVRLSNPAVVVGAFPRPALVSGTNSLVAVSLGAGGVVAALFRFSANVGVWARRISANLQTQWTAGGVLLSNSGSGDAFSEVTIAADGTGGAYAAWHTKTGKTTSSISSASPARGYRSGPVAARLHGWSMLRRAALSAPAAM